jgi:hypothetical protein
VRHARVVQVQLAVGQGLLLLGMARGVRDAGLGRLDLG